MNRSGASTDIWTPNWIRRLAWLVSLTLVLPLSTTTASAQLPSLHVQPSLLQMAATQPDAEVDMK